MRDRRSLSHHDAASTQWRAGPGDFKTLARRSTEQMELRGKLTRR